MTRSIFTAAMAVIVGVILLTMNDRAGARIFKRCELARELALKQVPEDQIGDWLCIAEHGSRFNSSAVNLKYKRFGGSAYYGIFQISDLYGCLRSSSICGLTCADLKDDEVEDDIDCMRKIYGEYNREIGDGFAAWPAHKTHCRNPAKYVPFRECLNEEVMRFEAYYKKKKAKAKKAEFESKAEFGKVYERCELALELRDKYQMQPEHIPTWVCIAYHESRFNTSAEGRLNADGSGDHGLFQISDIYWCSIGNSPGKACGVTCEDMRNSDITDDVRCIKTIFDEHQRISGNGFNAWSVYKPYCQGREDSFVHNCFDTTKQTTAIRPRPAITAPTIPKRKSSLVSVGKIYNRCELANDLLHKFNFPKDQVATWVCIAYHESSFNTSAEGRLNADGSGDHGLFQISDIYWCSPPGNGWACGVSCDDLKDSDISDDVQCIRKIFDEHQRLSGDGFNAWSVYKPHCHKGKSSSYVKGCFGLDDDQAITPALPVPAITAPTRMPQRKYGTKSGKVYKRCELARELFFKHQLSIEDSAMWTCIAQYQSNFNTSAVGYGAGDVQYHGMFQLSDEYWCSPPGRGWVCGLACSDLEDDDISDDLACMKHIYEEHQRISGDGFNAWAVYQPYCKGKAQNMINGCFEEGENAIIPTTTVRTSNRKPNVGVWKIYERCELARELYYDHKLPFEQIATWVCIAHRESNYNVSAIGRLNADGSEDHGIFQISDIYWCSPPGKGWVCGITCSDLEDNDLSDDVECMKKIFEEHTRLSGDGFTAWAVYRPYCQGRSDHYIKGCFEETTSLPPTTTTVKPTTAKTSRTTKRSTYSWFTPSTANVWTSTTTKATLPSTTTVRSTVTPRSSIGATKSTTSLYDFYLNHFGRPNTTPASFAAFTIKPSDSPKPPTSTVAARLTALQFTSDRTTWRPPLTRAPIPNTTKYSRFDQLFDSFRHGSVNK